MNLLRSLHHLNIYILEISEANMCSPGTKALCDGEMICDKIDFNRFANTLEASIEQIETHPWVLLFLDECHKGEVDLFE